MELNVDRRVRRQGINALAKQQRRINPAQIGQYSLTRLLSQPVVSTIGLLVIVMVIGCTETAEFPSAILPVTPATLITQPPPTVPPALQPSIAQPPVVVTPSPVTEGYMQPAVTHPLTPSPPHPFTPSPFPTLTPRPSLIVAVPAEWMERAETAVAQLNETGLNWQWQLSQSDDPAGLLAKGQAHLALVHNTDGFMVRQEPIALTVPFTYNWFEATDEEVQRILNGGHPIAQAMPWSDMTPNLKALRVHGLLPSAPNYPLQDSWSLVGAAGFETAVSELAPLLQMDEPVIELATVGDIMLDRSLGYVIKDQHSPQYPFYNVAPILTAADITVGNLECSLGDVGEPAQKSYTFQAPPEAVEALQLGGFDVLSLANNHAMDYGPEALLQGISLLQAGGIAPIGAGANSAAARTPYITEVNGLTMAFLGYVNVPIEASGTFFDTQSWTATENSPGLAWGEPKEIEADVSAVRPQVDLVIVVLHSGFEYIEEPGEAQMVAAHAAIDAGADIVIGHHAHILQGIEFYNGGVIVYGLGNFAFEIDGDPSTAILQVWLDAEGVRQLELIPALIQYGGQPRLAEPWEAGPILQQVYYLTTVVNIPNQ